MDIIFFFAIALVAYFLGSIPTGVIIGKKMKGLDIREHGSKNTGATNAYRVLGPKIGLTVLFLDILKGAIPVIIAKLVKLELNLSVIIGIITIIAHTFSIYLNFKGGKGVATALGVFLVLTPIVGLL